MKKINNLKIKLISMFFLLAIIGWSSGVFAQEIPQKISYQGKLLENGNPVTGTKSITFTIDTWTETHPGVQVTNGLYSVTLGETTPIPTSIFDNSSSLTLQISVAGTSLTPQTDILSVPYSYKAEKAVDAEKIAGNTVSATSPSTNQVLKWNGTTWAPGTDETGGLTLPYAGTSPYVGTDAFKITSTGWGDVAYFEINNPGTSGHALHLKSNGNQEVLNIENNGNSDALWIQHNGSSIYNYGIWLENNGVGGGILINNNSSSTTEAIRISNDNNDNALYVGNFGTGYAGYFYGSGGNVHVTGTLSKGAGSFKIDHPLDPENKYLYHSFVESPDMLNVYNGNIILDNNGEAIVELPEWFKALNKEFRYQLTPVGASMPNLYIKEEIFGNKFSIAGGKSNKKVSWQVTGIRQDPYANQHRIQVEVEKSAKEKGHYLHYKEYNQPIEKSIEAVKHPEILEKLNKNK